MTTDSQMPLSPPSSLTPPIDSPPYTPEIPQEVKISPSDPLGDHKISVETSNLSNTQATEHIWKETQAKNNDSPSIPDPSSTHNWKPMSEQETILPKSTNVSNPVNPPLKRFTSFLKKTLEGISREGSSSPAPKSPPPSPSPSPSFLNKFNAFFSKSSSLSEEENTLNKKIKEITNRSEDDILKTENQDSFIEDFIEFEGLGEQIKSPLYIALQNSITKRTESLKESNPQVFSSLYTNLMNQMESKKTSLANIAMNPVTESYQGLIKLKETDDRYKTALQNYEESKKVFISKHPEKTENLETALNTLRLNQNILDQSQQLYENTLYRSLKNHTELSDDFTQSSVINLFPEELPNFLNETNYVKDLGRMDYFINNNLMNENKKELNTEEFKNIFEKVLEEHGLKDHVDFLISFFHQGLSDSRFQRGLAVLENPSGEAMDVRFHSNVEKSALFFSIEGENVVFKARSTQNVKDLQSNFSQRVQISTTYKIPVKALKEGENPLNSLTVIENAQTVSKKQV